MANYLKSGTTSQTVTTKGNFKVGVSGLDDYGPTSQKGFYKGITPPVGGYTIYVEKATQGPSIHVAYNDTECMFFLKSFGATGTTISDMLSWATTQSTMWVTTADLTSADFPTPTPTPTITPTISLTPTITPTITPTPTRTLTPTPTPTRTLTPTPTPSSLPLATVSGATVSGGVYTANSSPFGSGTSYQLNGSSGYISYTKSTDYVLSGDFTIEWFQYQTSQPSNPRIFQIGNYPSIAIGASIEGNASSAILYLWLPGATSIKTFTSSSHLNTWIHFAVVRIGSSIKVYQDGTQIGSTITNSSSLGNSTQNLSIGQETTTTANSYFPGNITQFRWTNGLGIYTGNFTKPTGALGFTASANPFGGSNTSAITSGNVKFLLQ